MSKDCFHRTGRKLLSKIGKLILIVIIGYVTWVAVVSKHNAPQAERLYRTGKDLYEEKKDSRKISLCVEDQEYGLKKLLFSLRRTMLPQAMTSFPN